MRHVVVVKYQVFFRMIFKFLFEFKFVLLYKAVYFSLCSLTFVAYFLCVKI
jgi:hypothetical protein